MDYRSLLQISGLSSLESHRRIRFKKFAAKTLKNDKYATHWFPLHDPIKKTRHTHKYRLYKSPIFAMRIYLNQSEDKMDNDLTGLFNTP